jgi:hypothetical protein
MKVSLSHMKPLKNDLNIDKERRESTTIYFTSTRQSNECVGGIEWAEVGSLDSDIICWKRSFFLFVPQSFLLALMIIVRGFVPAIQASS